MKRANICSLCRHEQPAQPTARALSVTLLKSVSSKFISALQPPALFSVSAKRIKSTFRERERERERGFRFSTFKQIIFKIAQSGNGDEGRCECFVQMRKNESGPKVVELSERKREPALILRQPTFSPCPGALYSAHQFSAPAPAGWMAQVQCALCGAAFSLSLFLFALNTSQTSTESKLFKL